ncbi:MAG: WD40 repeat protein/tRNA A-37 threonylcarbamoyl transferase component Bud32 [Myxococcota bacterium]|jgi:WD40 repeat protein/tRNA A-37 threonylcarbamoyl transferase component Bud32
MSHDTSQDPPLPAPDDVSSWIDGDSAPAWSLSGADEDAPRYRLDRLLGKGGMGRVYVAEDRVLNRQVALKALTPSLHDDPAAQRRLTREALITAQLDHPGIVAVHDAGQLPDGVPFYTMRMVRGTSLAAALSSAEGLQQRLLLLRPLLATAEAVAYAHQAGIVHRDIKPANVLLGGLGEVQVVDWGLARPLVGEEESWAAALDGTASIQVTPGTVAGTPAYMSPEQARGEAPDPRSDVFSLGAMLCELLIGRPPYETRDGQQALRQARASALSLEPLGHEEIPAELAAICRRALSLQPSRRYPDAGALAAELARWFEGRRVEAYDYSSWELLRRLLRLWRVPLAAAGLLAIAVVAVVVVSSWQIRAERDRALDAQAEALAARSRSNELLADALLRQALSAVQSDDRAQAELLAVRAISLGAQARGRAVLAAFGSAGRPHRDSNEAAPRCPQPLFSTDGSRLLCLTEGALQMHDTASMAQLWSRPLAVAGPSSVVFTAPDAPLSVLQGETIYELDAETGEDRALHTTALEARFLASTHLYGNGDQMARLSDRAGPFALGCDWQLQAATALDSGQVARMCDTGRLIISLPHKAALDVQTPFQGELELTGLVELPGQGLLVVGTQRGDVGVIEVATGAVRSLSESTLGAIQQLAPSPDGRWVAVVGERGRAQIFAPAAGRWVASLPHETRAVGWDEETGQLLVLGTSLSRWSIRPPGAPYRLASHAGLTALAWAPDSSALALAGSDGTVEEASLPDGRRWRLPVHFDAATRAIAYSPDGRWLAATGMRGPELWAYDRQQGEGVVLPEATSYRRLGFLADGRLIGGSFARTLLAFRPGRTKQARLSYPLGSALVDLSGPADGSRAIGITEAGLIIEVLAGGGGPRPLATAPGGQAIDTCSDGLRFAVAHRDGVDIRARDGGLIQRLPAPGTDLRAVALSPDCSLVAAGGADSTIWVWSLESASRIAILRGHTSRITDLAFAPDGEQLASASWDHSARIWDLAVLQQPAESLIKAVLADWGATLEEIGRDE